MSRTTTEEKHHGIAGGRTDAFPGSLLSCLPVVFCLTGYNHNYIINFTATYYILWTEGYKDMKYLLGIDLGTSGTKTVLFDQNGKGICSATVEYPLYQPQNGWAEQDPHDWYNAAVSTIRTVLGKSGVDKKDVVSLGISGQMHGLVMLDENDEVIRPSIIWCDQRTAKECEEITAKVGYENLIRITANPALPGFTLSKLIWVRNHEPENYAKCKHVLLPKDYVRFMLTGDFATEVSDASGMQMLDVPNRCWSDELLGILDIDKSMLAKVYESCEVTGHISRRRQRGGCGRHRRGGGRQSLHHHRYERRGVRTYRQAGD